ncbi:MAG: FAD-binding protein, partial [Aestuariivirga sp.]
LECGATTKLSDIEKLLAAKNQILAFEPPNYSLVLGTKHAGSIGGALACNLAGPRRLKAGAARDHILGLNGVNGQGEIIRAGARVVKNVTGYDVPRLMAGSYGTLMVFTSVIFKVLPKPETEQTCILKDRGAADAVAQMAQAMATAAEISSAAYVPKRGTYLRVEGIKASVKARVDMLHAAIKLREVLTSTQSRELWQELRDVQPLAAQQKKQIWRIVMPPSEAADFLAALPFVHDYHLDWAGSLIWLSVEHGMDPRKYMNSGVATLIRADADARAKLDVFHPQSTELSALSARIKNAFDPKELFNPGKIYREF